MQELISGFLFVVKNCTNLSQIKNLVCYESTKNSYIIYD